MVIIVVCGEWTFFIFTYALWWILFDCFMWDFRNRFSRLSNKAEGKYFLVLLLWAQTKSSSITKDCLHRHWLLYALPDEDIDFFFLWCIWNHSLDKQLSCCLCIIKQDSIFCCSKSFWIFRMLSIYFPFRLCAEMLYKCSGFDRVKVLIKTKGHSP